MKAALHMKTKPPPLFGALSSGGSNDHLDAESRDFAPVQTGESNVSFVLSGAELKTVAMTLPPDGEVAKTLSFMRRADNAGLVFSSVPESTDFASVAGGLLGVVVFFVALRGRRARA